MQSRTFIVLMLVYMVILLVGCTKMIEEQTVQERIEEVPVEEKIVPEIEELVPSNDLELLDVSYPEKILPDEPISLEVKIKNRFRNSISGVKIEAAFLNMKAKTEKIVTLPSFSESSVSIPIGAFPCQGNYLLQVEIDPENVVQEVNNENNAVNITIVVAGGGSCGSLFRPNYYDYCWEYDCDAQIPFPKLTESKIPLVAEIRPAFDNMRPRIMVVFLYAYEPLSEDKLQILNADESDVNSLRYAAKWFEDKAALHGVDMDIDIQFSSQQHKVPDELIITTFEESFSKDLYGYIVGNLPQYIDYDIIVPFYYSSQVISFASHASKPNSFTLFSMQYAENAFNPAFEEGTYAATFAHELSHIYGATDKYSCYEADIESERCQYALQHGVGCIIESDDPQELGKDIMCHSVPFRCSRGWCFKSPPLQERIVIEATAKEFGWFDLDGDGIVEINDPCPFLKNNTC